MCFFLCSGEPIEDDPRQLYPNRFQVGMMQAPRADPLCCLVSCFCPCCAQIYIRRKALHFDMRNYACCQGYFDGLIPCFRSGDCGESACPNTCLCCESFLCNGCAVSATRMMVMDRHNLQPDPWDNSIIRFNNCIQILSILFQCLSICIPGCEDCANVMNCIVNCTYAATQGCMTAQINVELEKREDYRPMQNETMERV